MDIDACGASQHVEETLFQINHARIIEPSTNDQLLTNDNARLFVPVRTIDQTGALELRMREKVAFDLYGVRLQHTRKKEKRKAAKMTVVASDVDEATAPGGAVAIAGAPGGAAGAVTAEQLIEEAPIVTQAMAKDRMKRCRKLYESRRLERPEHAARFDRYPDYRMECVDRDAPIPRVLKYYAVNSTTGKFVEPRELVVPEREYIEFAASHADASAASSSAAP